MRKRLLQVVAMALLLSALLTLGCGGGGSGSSQVTAPPSGTGTVIGSVN